MKRFGAALLQRFGRGWTREQRARVPESHVLRIDPRAASERQRADLSTLVEVVQFHSPSDALDVVQRTRRETRSSTAGATR